MAVQTQALNTLNAMVPRAPRLRPNKAKQIKVLKGNANKAKYMVEFKLYRFNLLVLHKKQTVEENLLNSLALALAEQEKQGKKPI
jgi:uncharacterized coiled-coil protein SlyX